MSIAELGVVISLGGLVGYLIISNLLIRIKNKQMFMATTQAELDRLSVYNQAQEIFKSEYEKSNNNEGFLKFMSTSRDWAFQYIEDVQKDLYALKDVFDSTGSSPKTVAQANNLNEKIRKVLENLPTEDRAKDV
jgi:hypothetical protein